LDPNFPVACAELSTALVQQGKYEEAIAEMQKALDRGQNRPLVIGIRGCAYSKAGNKAEAHKLLEDLKGRSKGAFVIARIHAALGEKDQAFEWLRKSCAERDSRVIWIKVDPTMVTYAPTRALPRCSKTCACRRKMTGVTART
jgi:predicted Zn-dependent protease